MTTILVVDDRPLNREFLVTLLGYGGYRTLEAGDGAEALEAIRTERPGLVITDIQMPTMDGYDMVRHLRADPQLAGIPIIFYTATYRAREARALAESCGVAAVLSKPSDPEQILHAIQDVLNRSETLEIVAPGAPVAGSEPAVPAGEDGAGCLNGVESARQWLDEIRGREHELLQERDTLLKITGRMSQALDYLQTVRLRLTALIELDLELFSQRNPEALLETFCQAAHEFGPALYAAVGICEHNGEGLRYFRASGYDEETLARLGAMSPCAGVLGRLAAERRPLRLAGGDADPAALGLPACHPPIHSFLGVPIATPSQFYGWLFLAEKEGALAFSEADTDIAVTMAMQVAIAYENLLLFEELRQAEAEMQVLATTDSLTGTLNRRTFERLLEGELARVRRYHAPLALIMCDIDHFKQVNDTFGHGTGDTVIRAVADLVKGNIRSADVFARWGGEEFMILAPQSDAEQARVVAEKLRQAIAAATFGTAGHVTVSFGVTVCAPEDDSNTFLKRVDDALYNAKAKGRNRVAVFS